MAKTSSTRRKRTSSTRGKRRPCAPASTRPTKAARRDTGSGATWTMIAAILNAIAAALSLGTATLHARPGIPVSHGGGHGDLHVGGAEQWATEEARRLGRGEI